MTAIHSNKLKDTVDKNLFLYTFMWKTFEISTALWQLCRVSDVDALCNILICEENKVCRNE